MIRDMSQVTRLREVSDERRTSAAKELRGALFQRCRAAIEQMGDDISGFALVVWDREGNLRSAYDASNGPIRAPLVPTLAADALNRHVAVMLSAAKQSVEE